MIKDRNIEKDEVSFNKIKTSSFFKYSFNKFQEDVVAVAPAGAGAATGTTGDTNLWVSGGDIYKVHVKGTQTLLGPTHSASGLDVSLDQTDNDGVEIAFGGITALGKHAFTVDTDEDFFARLKFSIADVSGTDDCAFGFRKAEAFQAAIDNYDEMAALNVISGNITRETILNNNATVAVDTGLNWADGETHTLEVRIVKGGKARFYVDGVDYTADAGAAFTFDSGEVVVPFFYFLHASDVAGAVNLKEFECGYLSDKR